ncbi:unnamed protein product [Clonostachys solani]|uniref:DUF6570 domain-containing protein n=1 Tax=Clonostachys solani TaxID=160281 RepID=A0A9N9ZHM4_9HYPO|nr:unnamed protein product [Clonostachys solani]
MSHEGYNGGLIPTIAYAEDGITIGDEGAVRRQVVESTLAWLQRNNPHYWDVEVDEAEMVGWGAPPHDGYAAESWIDYAVSAEVSPDIVQATVGFLRDETTFQRWAQLYQADRPWDHKPGPPGASGLYYVSLGGLVGTARNITTEGADVNAQGGKHGNALQAASYKGHQEVVQLLLDKGADINVQGVPGEVAGMADLDYQVAARFYFSLPHLEYLA